MSQQVPQTDFLSALPFELFSDIAFHLTITNLTVRPTRLKSLSRTTKKFRSYCLAWGLFQNLKVTIRYGVDSLSHINAFLSQYPDVADKVRKVTLHDTVLGDSNLNLGSQVSFLLQRCSEVTSLRIRGSSRSKPLLLGPLVSSNGLLYKTLLSGRYLTKLTKIELDDLTVTSYVVDIITSIPTITRLHLHSIRLINSHVTKRLIPPSTKVLYLTSLKEEIIHALFTGKAVFPQVKCFSFELNMKYPEAWCKDRETYERFVKKFPELKTWVVNVGMGKHDEWRGGYSSVKIETRDLVFVVREGEGKCVDEAFFALANLVFSYKNLIIVSTSLSPNPFPFLSSDSRLESNPLPLFPPQPGHIHGLMYQSGPINRRLFQPRVTNPDGLIPQLTNTPMLQYVTETITFYSPDMVLGVRYDDDDEGKMMGDRARGVRRLRGEELEELLDSAGRRFWDLW